MDDKRVIENLIIKNLGIPEEEFNKFVDKKFVTSKNKDGEELYVFRNSRFNDEIAPGQFNNIAENNIASQAVARKLGFAEDLNNSVYRLTRNEFIQQRAVQLSKKDNDTVVI